MELTSNLSEFQNADGETFSNAGDPVSAVAMGVGELAKLGTKAIGSGKRGRKHELELGKQQANLSRLELLKESMKSKSEAAKEFAGRHKVLILSIVGLVAIAGIVTTIIILKKKGIILKPITPTV